MIHIKFEKLEQIMSQISKFVDDLDELSGQLEDQNALIPDFLKRVSLEQPELFNLIDQQ